MTTTSTSSLLARVALAILAASCGADEWSPAGSEFNSAAEQRHATVDHPDGGVDSTAPINLRVVAANISSGNYQSYDPGHGARILRALTPDVVLIQEFNYKNNTAADFRAFLDANFGTEFFYTREPTGHIPNGIISRYPIVDSGSWDDLLVNDRGFAWARIDIPGARDLWAISVHLLTSSSTKRNSEAQRLIQLINQNIPVEDYVVLGGDLNTGSRTENCITTFRAVFMTGGNYPVDQRNNGGTNASRSKPYDWVLADADLHPFMVPVEIGSRSYPSGLVFDSRVFSPLGDVAPVLYSDSAATNMQHMAVVRDYRIEP